MGFYEEEFKSVLQLGIYLGQLPLVLPESDKIDDLNLTFFSVNSTYYMVLFGAVTVNWLSHLANFLSTGRNFLLGYKLLVNLITLRVTMGLKTILSSVKEFDEDYYRLSGKKVALTRSNIRKFGWLLLILCNILISMIITKPQLTFRFGLHYALQNMARNFFFLLYCIICMCLTTRQYSLGHECKLFFDQLKKSAYDERKNVLSLMKLRLLHLKLVSCCDTFSGVFSIYNLAISFTVFVECITIFTELYMLYIENITVFNEFGVTTTCMSFVSEIIHHIALVALSSLVKAQNLEIKYILTSEEYTETSEQFRKELKLFLKQTEVLPVKITACDLFCLDYATLPPFTFSLLANFLLIVQSQSSIRRELLAVFFPTWLLPVSTNSTVTSNYTYH